MERALSRRMSRLTLRSALAAMLLISAALLPASAAASAIPANQRPSVFQSAPDCWVASVLNPHKIISGGPHISAGGSGACNGSIKIVYLYIQIYMWQNNVWNQVASNTPGCSWCSSISGTTTSGVCAGTKQYFTQVQLAEQPLYTWYFTDWTYSNVVWITC